MALRLRRCPGSRERRPSRARPPALPPPRPQVAESRRAGKEQTQPEAWEQGTRWRVVGVPLPSSTSAPPRPHTHTVNLSGPASQHPRHPEEGKKWGVRGAVRAGGGHSPPDRPQKPDTHTEKHAHSHSLRGQTHKMLPLDTTPTHNYVNRHNVTGTKATHTRPHTRSWASTRGPRSSTHPRSGAGLSLGRQALEKAGPGPLDGTAQPDPGPTGAQRRLPRPALPPRPGPQPGEGSGAAEGSPMARGLGP